jgi:histidyl-tRNA synthetase
MPFQVPRGTADLLPEDTRLWRYVESLIHRLCEKFNYEEIRTPMFEQTELFNRGVGETTDIVEKEMYTFQSRGGDSLTLKPEGTAPVVRSYVENKMYGDPNQPVKLYYVSPMFRYERPQAGRQRQFHQFGVEAIGSHDPAIDAEVISLAWSFFKELELSGLSLEINSVGCPTCRPLHREKLIQYLTPHKEELCKDCKSRLERNPLRILDCKVDRCREIVQHAPTITEYLCGECDSHFEQVKSYLDELGIPYLVNPRLVRGLDYYTRTSFEIMDESIGAKSTVCGGGRYNGLVKEIGGPDQPGIGFGLGLERLMLALKGKGIELPYPKGIDFYVIALGEAPARMRVKILQMLRAAGFRAETDYMERKMKAQLKAADRLGARYALILGDEELNQGIVQVKNLDNGEQQEVMIDHLIENCKELTKKNWEM